MLVETAKIPGFLIVTPKKFGDERGFFSETFRASALAPYGVTHAWVQDNHSMSGKRGIVRGLHFQAPPRAQAKLLRVVHGAILDVAVDIRKGSPTYGQHVAVELSALNWRQIYVPAGMAHGYCTLSDKVEVIYKTSDEYAPETEGGLLWNDPALGITWPTAADEVTVNARDASWPRLAALQSPFEWRG